MSAAEPVVFLVDDDSSMLRALSRLVGSTGRKVEAFASPRAFLNRAPHDGPGCVVLDLRMPELSGLDVQKALTSGARALPIVFISGHGKVPAAVQAMKEGAVDFLTKPFQDDALLASIDAAIQRSLVMRRDQAEIDDLEARVRTLTPRERDVLPLVAKGLPNKQIASRLGTSLQTIKVHRARIMAKMRASSLADLVRMASRTGIDS